MSTVIDETFDWKVEDKNKQNVSRLLIIISCTKMTVLLSTSTMIQKMVAQIFMCTLLLLILYNLTVGFLLSLQAVARGT